MKRRELLLSFGGLSASVVGGAYFLQEDGTGRRVQAFDIYQPGTEAFHEIGGVQAPPEVSFRSDQQTVRVQGKFLVGSSDCDVATIEGTEYDRERETFTVRIGSGSKNMVQFGCHADESADAYRVILEFEEGLPEYVRVVETGDPTGQRVEAKNPDVE